MRNQARTAFTAVLTVPITPKGTPPAFDGAQGNAEFTAGAHQPGASSIRPDDQLDRHPPLGGTRQPSSSSEQKASHFFRSTSNAAASATVTARKDDAAAADQAATAKVTVSMSSASDGGLIQTTSG
jgi:hypothetical protein